jgi:hypothetical protein
LVCAAFCFGGAKNVGIAIRIVPVIGAGLKDCHGPSAPWPARQNTARKKKPATPVGMTEFGKCKTQERAGQARLLQSEGGMELTEGQMRVVERLFGAGFRPIAIPPYESALIMRKGECVALLGPVENGGLKLLAPVTFLVDGNLSVRLKKSAGDVFVWKKKEVAATEEKLKELEEFQAELVGILEMEERRSGGVARK